MKRALFLLIAVLCFPGCSLMTPTPKPHFYVLAAPPEQSGVSAALTRGPRVGILSVALPAYLRRPQMVLREDNAVGVMIEDFHRWGEELDLGIARVLSSSLNNGLRLLGGSAAPLRSGSAVDLRVQVDVRAFEGRPDGQARLEAVWNVQRDGAIAAEGLFKRHIPAGGDFPALVQAQSALLDQLGSELAAAITGIWTENTGSEAR